MLGDMIKDDLFSLAYPVAPGSNEYVLGRPFVQEATLHLPSGKNFRIEAENLGGDRQYIASVTLNGIPLDRLFIRHAEILAGGELRFTMSDKADARWSLQPHQLPFSRTPVRP